MSNIAEALLKLRPGARWNLPGEQLYDNIEWNDDKQTKPSRNEVEQQMVALATEKAKVLYKKQRAAEYPPMTDYLDAVVKNDTEQMQAYIDACLAVKAKYPKPE